MITITYLQHTVLDIPSLSIPKGQTAVIGSNGAGKSTLLRLIGGLVLPESGNISIDDTNPRTCTIGYVNEFPERNVVFTRVFDEIASPLRFLFYPCAKTDERVRNIAAQTGIAHLLKRRISDLSGGEMVLVALATALVAGPEVLVLDEVDSHTDPKTTDALNALLRSSGVPYCIRSTQQMDVAAQADQVIMLENGRVTDSGAPEAVFAGRGTTCFYPVSWRFAAWK